MTSEMKYQNVDRFLMSHLINNNRLILDPSQSSNQASGILTYHNQPSEISDDELRESVRSLKRRATIRI